MGWPLAAAAAITAGSALSGMGHDWLTSKANIREQEKFAKEGIRWKVQDAIAAGIHPLAALGAQTMSFHPNQVGAGQYLANAGQQISSMLLKKYMTIKLAKEVAELDALKLNNAATHYKLQMARNMGQADAAVQIVPKQVTSPDPHDPNMEAGVISEEQWARTKDGYLKPVISQSISEPAESDWFYNFSRFVSKGLETAQILLQADKPSARDFVWRMRPKSKGEKVGWEWRFNPFRLGYKLVPIGPEGHQEYEQERLWKKHTDFRRQMRRHSNKERFWLDRYSYPAPKKYW